MSRKRQTEGTGMEKSYMINMWDRITLYCMNHKDPKPMKLVSNTEKIRSPFYGCSKYIKDSEAPDEPPCPNRLNMDDYQGIVLKFLDIVAEGGPTMDYTNYSFEYKGGRQRSSVRVLKYSDNEIRLGVLNKTVMGI